MGEEYTGDMKRESFRIVFDGEAVRDGLIDVYDLAPALLALGDVLGGANEVLNQDRAKISLKVSAGSRRGSHPVDFQLFQGILRAIEATLFVSAVIGPREILEIIGFSRGKDIVVSLMDLLKWLGGERPSEVTTLDGENIQISVRGRDNNITVNKNVYTVYQNPRTTEGLERLSRPLHTEGIDKIGIEQDGEEVASITGDDIHSFTIEDISTLDFEEGEIRGTFRIDKVSFDPKLKWALFDGEQRIHVLFEDEIFREKMEKQEVEFLSGDFIECVIKTKTYISDKKIKTEYVLVEVVNLKHAPRQIPLIEKEREE